MKVTQFRMKIIEKGNILAAFSIKFYNEIIIHNILLCMNKDMGTYIQFPSQQYQDKETGQMKYRSHIEINPDLKEYIRYACDKLYRRKLDGK